MASISCTIHLTLPSTTNTSSSSTSRFSQLVSKCNSQFLGNGKRLGSLRECKIGSKICPTNGSRTKCWFTFGTNGVDSEGAGIYGSQKREDFDKDDVEQYFNYMGMLAVEGTYDKMNDLLKQNIHPVDILLLMASSEGDLPKIEELLRAGAKFDVKDADGRTALDRAANDEIKQYILGFSVQKA
ncbi:hypothetical protein MKW98_023966 [Papaver atlanticum]|uniref:Protein LHCP TRANSLOCATION DEFECT n=1 Tax=Papaver atlanticum TaxID=357466 RepID=A0AAD4T115_9MAGN|nr:hypothetical protein MKW98_023966 [Papaver atlanticum]